MTNSEIIMAAFERRPAWDWEKGVLRIPVMPRTPTRIDDQDDPSQIAPDSTVHLWRKHSKMRERPAWHFMGRRLGETICCAVHPID